MQTYTKGRGVVEIANGGATARSPAHGAWKRIGPHELRDPAGNLLPGSNTRRDAVAGERINVEPIPALP